MSDSYVTSKAILKCSCGDRVAQLTVYPDRTVFLTGKPMANISDHISMYNIAPFGKCHTVCFPPTGAATAANHGRLTPMPCVPGTDTDWINGKDDYIIKGKPALLKSSFCRCKWGGIITVTNDGQIGEGSEWIQKINNDVFCGYKLPQTAINSNLNTSSVSSPINNKSLETHSVLNGKYNNANVGQQSLMPKLLSNIVGAKDVEKQFYNCFIRRIECYYNNGEKDIKTVLYNRGDSVPDSLYEKNVMDSNVMDKDTFYCRITNLKSPEYYYITNYKGKEIELKCLREVNSCTETEHKQYIIDYIDINDKSLKTETKDISEGKLKLKYFNLFGRTLNYTVKTAGIGAMLGNTLDLICALRFIHLPDIRSNDNDYGCYTSLIYKECPNASNIPQIVINTYPDIEFNLKIGFGGFSGEYYADTSNKNTVGKTNFSFEFGAEYASVYKHLNFDNVNTEELDSETQRGSLFYQAINALGYFFKSASQITKELKQTIETIYGNNNNNLSKDLARVGGIFGKLGTMPEWISGSLEITPSIAGKWRYSVSDDLTTLGRNIEIELGAECSGELSIDLIQVYVLFFQKAKKATTAVAVTTSVASGGIASIPALLINFLVDNVASWLINKFKEGVKFELIIFGNINLKSLKIEWDTSREDVLEGVAMAIEVNPGIKLCASLEYKTSISLLSSVKAEGKIEASTSAAAELTFGVKMDVIDGTLGLSPEFSINPFTFRIEYAVLGSFNISKYSFKGGNKGKVVEWSTKEYNIPIKRWEWMKINNKDKASK